MISILIIWNVVLTALVLTLWIDIKDSIKKWNELMRKL